MCDRQTDRVTDGQTLSYRHYIIAYAALIYVAGPETVDERTLLLLTADCICRWSVTFCCTRPTSVMAYFIAIS